MAAEVMRVPRYFLMSGAIVLDRDVYRLFDYSNVWRLRKKLAELENKGQNQGFFRLSTFDKYFIKTQKISF